MSDSSQELQDEIPDGERFFVVADLGSTHAKAGTLLYSSVLAAARAAEDLNRERAKHHIRKKIAPARVSVYVVYVRLGRDVSSRKQTWGKGRHKKETLLVRVVPLFVIKPGDLIAFAVEERLIGSG